MTFFLTTMADLERVHAKSVSVNGEHLLVVLDQAEVYVTSAICTHRGAPLQDGFVADGTIVCPWHRAMFDLRTGKVVSGPTQQCLQTYPVVVEEGNVYLDVQPDGLHGL